ncbi:MAG TPA: hypothetical protein VKS21_03905 [Spirochaetota bacterium]|nr:hypothetical protein [Spirochaetota bacterium]
MKKKITFFLMTLFIFISCRRGLNDLEPIERDNPTDSGAENYQGYDTKDGNKDGEGDYTIQINGGEQTTIKQNVSITMDGPEAKYVLISTNADLSDSTQYEFARQLTYSLPFDKATNILYIGFIFYNGDQSVSIYSNSIFYDSDPNQTAWNSYPFSMTINGGAEYTINTNLLIEVDASPHTVKYRCGERLDSTNLYTFPASNIFSCPIEYENTIRDIFILVEFHSATGYIKTISNNITFLPWKAAVSINDGDATTPVKGVTLTIDYPATAEQMKIGNEPDLSDSAGWEPVSANKSWTLKTCQETEKTVYISFTNAIYSLGKAPVSDSINSYFEIPVFCGFDCSGNISNSFPMSTNFEICYFAGTGNSNDFRSMVTGIYDAKGVVTGELYYRISNISLGSVFTSNVNLDLALRDRGPAGGWIFYDKGSYSDGWRYLEAAPGEYSGVFFGTHNSNVNGSNAAIAPELEGIGDGKTNTIVIVQASAAMGESGRAAQLCYNYETNLYTDWFLASKDEIELMYQNLRFHGVGGFQDADYWTSSERDEHYAWKRNFSLGGVYDWYAKITSCYVRALRYF